MVEFINKLTGSLMLVAEDRVEEYKAAGHTLAASAPVKPAEKKPAEKKPTRKSTAKK